MNRLKMKKIQLLILTIITLGFYSCETGIDVLAPYEEQTVLYGMLDTRENVHYIKINKAFVNPDQNAAEIAQEFDSLYHPEALSVQLQEYRSQSPFGEPVTLDTTSEISKEPGVFASPNQLLYKTPAGFTLKTDSDYEILVRKSATGELVVKAFAEVVGDIKLTGSTNSLPTVTFSNGNDFRDKKISWTSAEDAKIYELDIRLNFTEVNTNSGARKDTSVVWKVFREIKSPNTFGGNEMEFEMQGEQFYGSIASQLEARADIIREVDTVIAIEFSYSTQELLNYLEVAKPSTFLNDVKPEYTNVEGGLGLFTSRGGKVFKKGLSSPSVEQLIDGELTRGLNFRR